MSVIETTLEKEIEKYQHIIPIGFKIISRIPGIVQKFGKTAGIEANWAFEALDEKENKYVLMFCNPGIFTILDYNTIDKIRIINDKTVTWYLMKSGYIVCHTITTGEIKTVLYLHQILTNHIGFGKGKKSVDHLNRNKLDNRISNLKISSQSEQNQNTGKRSRKIGAKELPDGIKHEDLPKFVVYYKECLNKEKEKYREFFRVEKHPFQNGKGWATSKSNKISIQEKLEQAKLYVEELDLAIGYSASK